MIFRYILSVVLACSVLAATANAQNEVESTEETLAVESSDDLTVSGDGLVSLDFRDADIRNVFKILSFKSGVNIVASPEVSGVVSIQLTDVPWKQALEVILQTYGYAYERKGSIIMITTVENLKKRREDAMLLAEQESVMTQTFVLNFSKASEVVAAIEKMKSDRGNIDFDDRTNTLIITDTQSRLELIEGVVQKLDRVTHQVSIEAKIVETNFTDQENLGIDWVLQASATGSARPTIYPFTTTTANKYVPDAFPSADDGDFTFGTLSFSQASAVFEALKTRSDTNILSSPRVTTLDNKPAQIMVGQQYPIPSYVYNEEQARLQVNGFEYKDIGIIFDVTPHVNDAGYVTMDIEPKITAILSFVTVESTTLPLLSNESARTTVMVKDGDTVVIGGLVKTQEDDVKKKVPFLGSVPVLGYAFRKSDKTVTKQDLLIFMTPHVVTPKIETAFVK